MTTETLNEVLILRYLENARDALAAGDEAEVYHCVRCVMLRSGLDRTEAYHTLTHREAELGYFNSQKESA
jgi:hypothetical protein